MSKPVLYYWVNVIKLYAMLMDIYIYAISNNALVLNKVLIPVILISRAYDLVICGLLIINRRSAKERASACSKP